MGDGFSVYPSKLLAGISENLLLARASSVALSFQAWLIAFGTNIFRVTYQTVIVMRAQFGRLERGTRRIACRLNRLNPGLSQALIAMTADQCLTFFWDRRFER
jgi:hypothetical protein